MVGCVGLTGLAMIVQHDFCGLAEKTAKCCSHEPKEFLNYFQKEASHNPLIIYKEIFGTLFDSYRKSFREEINNQNGVS